MVRGENFPRSEERSLRLAPKTKKNQKWPKEPAFQNLHVFLIFHFVRSPLVEASTSFITAQIQMFLQKESSGCDEHLVRQP